MFLFAHIDSITLPLEDPILKFLLILVIILAAPLLLNKLKIPYLLGLIIAGAVIGPHGLNLVLRDSSIILSGTAGLLYIMFLSGLDMDMSDFKKNSWRSLIFGALHLLRAARPSASWPGITSWASRSTRRSCWPGCSPRRRSSPTPSSANWASRATRPSRSPSAARSSPTRWPCCCSR